MSPAAAVAAACAPASPACAPRSRRRRRRSAASRRGRMRAPAAAPRVYSPARGRALAEHAGLDIGAAQLGVDRLLDVVGIAFLDHQHRAFARAELAQFLGHQRIGDVEHVDRDAACAVEVGEIEPRSARNTPLVSPPTAMMPTPPRSPAMTSLSLFSRMNCCAAGRRSSTLRRSCEKMTGGCASRLYSKRGGPAMRFLPESRRGDWPWPGTRR